MTGSWLAEGDLALPKKSLASHFAFPDCLLVSFPFQLTFQPSLAQNCSCILEKWIGGHMHMWKICSGPSQRKLKNYVNISLAVNIHKFWICNHSTVFVGLLHSHLVFIVSCLIVNWKMSIFAFFLQRQSLLCTTRFMQEWKSQRICLVSLLLWPPTCKCNLLQGALLGCT